MLQNSDMRSKYLQACSSVQNQGFWKKMPKKGRRNNILGNRSNKENYNNWQPLQNLNQHVYGMLQNQDMQSGCLQACCSVQNEDFCQKVVKK
jgi:hypothetical protein